MNFNGTYRDLYQEDNDSIKRELLSHDESLWYQNDIRQKSYIHHVNTNSIVYAWCPPEDYQMKTIVHIKPDQDKLSELVWNSAEKIKSKFNVGSRIVRLMLARIPPKSDVGVHSDLYPLSLIHRCHHVIISNRECEFGIAQYKYNFQEGQVFELNNQCMHYVKNKGDDARVHLICDILEE